MQPEDYQQDRLHIILRFLQRLTEVALFAYVLCAVISISAMQAAYILALVAWVVRVVLSGSTRRLRFPLIVPVFAFILASILATLTAVAPLHSLQELRNVFEIALFYLVVNDVTEKRAATLIQGLIAMGALMAIYGLGQSVLKGVDFRIHGTMSTYMTFAGLLMMIALMALALLVFQPSRQATRWLLPALLMLIAALLMTHTRNAWLGLLAGAGVILALRQPMLILTLPLLVVAVLVLAPPAVKARLFSVVDPNDSTIQQRLYMWRSGVKMIRDYPWTGVGMGGVRRVYPAYKDPNDPRDPKDATYPLSHLHNNVLQVTVERGLLGLACWVWLWLAYLRVTWSIYRQVAPQDTRAKALVVGSLASVLGFHVAGIFEHTFGDAELVTLVYFLMALPFVPRAVDPQHPIPVRL